MKKVLILALAVAAMGFAGACTQDPPPPRHVYHHYYRDNGPAVGTPTNEGSDNFHAVTKPDSYSQ